MDYLENMLKNKQFEVIYELTEDLAPGLEKGRLYGKAGTILWTPTEVDRDGTLVGNIIPYVENLVEIAPFRIVAKNGKRVKNENKSSADDVS